MIRNSHLSLVLALILGQVPSIAAQSNSDVASLIPGTPVERELGAGESHSYRIALTSGQIVRIRLDQRVHDQALVLSAPDGSQLVEVDFTGIGEPESLVMEAATAGEYRVTARCIPASTWQGAYRLEAAVHSPASAQDRHVLAAQALMLESTALRAQGPESAEKAIEKLRQALDVWRELQEPTWVAVALGSIGDVYAIAGKFAEALTSYEQALASARESRLRAREAVILNTLSGLSYSQREYERSAEYDEQALAIQRELNDRGGEGTTLNNLGITFNTMRRVDRGIPQHEQALAIKRELKDRVGEGGTLADLGWAYLGASRSQEAISSFEQALVVFRELKIRNREEGALVGLGTTNRSLSRLEKAIEYYEQALVVQRELKKRSEEGVTLASLASAYSALGRYDKFFEYAEPALAISRETGNRYAEGRSLYDIGAVYLALDQLDKAAVHLEQALVINREVKDRQVEAFTLRSLGGVHRKRNEPAKAIEYYEQALAILRPMKARPHEASTLNLLGQAYRSQKEYDKAIEYSGLSLAIAREVKNPEYALSALSNLAWTENDRGNLAAARAHIEEGLNVAESLRSDLVSPASRTAYLASVQTSYQLYTDILMRQHQAEPAKGFDALAVDVSERQRARGLLDLLVESGTDVRKGVDPALLEREMALARQLNDKARTLTDTPEKAAALKLEIGQLETEYERVQVAIRKANPHYAALVQPEPLKLREIQQQLDADTLMLEYALGTDRSYLWAITRDSLKSYELPKGADIEKSALDLYGRISVRDGDLADAANELGRMVLAPVAAELGARRLVVVADGALQYIPFAVLPKPGASDGRPLVVDHEIVSLPSASALAIQRAELAGRQPAPKMLAVIADPVFDPLDSRVKALGRKAPDKAATQLMAANDARSIEHLAEAPKGGKTTTRVVIPRLPYTRQEASRLTALVPPASSLSAVDFKASRETVLSGELSQYRFVHFATHGILDSDRPGLSSLVLSMVGADGSTENGFLRANDIYNMKLPADLVVLSACKTGLGKDVKGEGLVGLTRGFMYAGAARVVVSLWNVNDRATADLMTKFYERMMKRGERPAAALRAAQVEMWRQKRWQAPYFWSAFVLQGEWR